MPATAMAAILLSAAGRGKGQGLQLAGKTGVGEAMNAAQADFLKIDWNTIAAEDIHSKDRDMPIILERKKAAIAYVNGPSRRCARRSRSFATRRTPRRKAEEE